MSHNHKEQEMAEDTLVQIEKRSAWMEIVILCASILVIGCISFLIGRNMATAEAIAKQQKAVTHAIDSLKREYAKNEEAKKPIEQAIAGQQTIIVNKGKEVIKEAAKIEKIPYTLVGSDLRTRLEASLALPWEPDTAQVNSKPQAK